MTIEGVEIIRKKFQIFEFHSIRFMTTQFEIPRIMIKFKLLVILILQTSFFVYFVDSISNFHDYEVHLFRSRI